MIYGYEEPVQMPTMGVYDTTLMQAYIQGVRELYLQALLEMKDFMKQYSDFYSPINSLNEAFHNETTGGAGQLINQMIANGINPFKSPEARAAISRFIATRDVAKLASYKQQAKTAELYLLNLSELEAKGLYNANWEKQQGYDLSTWDANKVWTRVSPDMYKDLYTITSPWFDELLPSDLESDGKYNYFGIQEDLMRPIVNQQMSDFMHTKLGKYHYDTFESDYKLRNPNATDDEVMTAFKNDIIQMNGKRMFKRKEADPFAIDEAQHKHKMLEIQESGRLDRQTYSHNADKDFEIYKEKYRFDQEHAPKDEGSLGFSTAALVYAYTLASTLNQDVNTFNPQNTSGAQQFLITKQTNLLSAHCKKEQGKDRYTESGINAVISGMGTTVGDGDIANLLGSIKSNKPGEYILDANTLRNVYARQHILSRFEGSLTKTGTREDYRGFTETARSDFRSSVADGTATYRPTRRVISYLSKDGTIRTMAECVVSYKNGDKTESEKVLVDLGMRSNPVTNRTTNLGIDINKSHVAISNSRFADGMGNTPVINYTIGQQ